MSLPLFPLLNSWAEVGCLPTVLLEGLDLGVCQLAPP